MSGSALQRLRSFAATFQLPLLFAVRFLRYRSAAVWVIVEDAPSSTPSIKVSVADWIQSLRPVLWNEYAYMIAPGTCFQVVYSPEIKGENVPHREYGEQVVFRVITPNRSIDIVGTESVRTSAFFEAYNLIETKAVRDDTCVCVTYEPESSALSIADLIYRMNQLPTDDEGRRIYDAIRAISELAQGKHGTLVNRGVIESIGTAMCNIGALCILGYGSPEDTLRKWLTTGGQE